MSRATTLGNGDPSQSALFFMGSNVTASRLTNMSYQARGHNQLSKIVKRNTWIKFQRSRLRKKSENISNNELNNIFKWAQKERISKNQIQDIIDREFTKKSTANSIDSMS